MAELWRHQLHAWSEFYLILGGAAAALTGLLFVAISIAPHTISARTARNVRAFVTPTVAYFVTVLVAAGFMTMPTLTPQLLALLLALGGIAGLGYMNWNGAHRQWREGRLGADDWAWYVALPMLGYALLLAAALEVRLEGEYGLESAALALLILLVTAIRNAWDLVIWMAQQPRGER